MEEHGVPRVGRRQFLWLVAAGILSGCTQPAISTSGLGQSGQLSAAVGGSVRPRRSTLPSSDVGTTPAITNATDATSHDALLSVDNVIRQVAADNNQFAFDLMDALRSITPNENLVVSPLSIYTAFAMLLAGAQGDTATQLATTLHYEVPASQLHSAMSDLMTMLSKSDNEASPTVTIANGLWGRQDVAYESAFTDTLSHYYGTTLQPTDFANGAAVDAINQWVDEATHGKISRILSQLDPNTALVLANAIYFYGQWATPFNAANTSDAPFTTIDNSVKNVPMMHLTARFSYIESGNYQVVALPYKGGQLRLIVVLPAADSFASVEQSFTTSEFTALIEGLESARHTRVALSLPKFEDAYTTNLQLLFAALGLTLPFGDTADFTGISNATSLKVDQALHQATITIDESGTEAAAATAITITTLAAEVPQPTIEMNVNRPFLYLLQDQASGAILFAGRRVVG